MVSSRLSPLEAELRVNVEVDDIGAQAGGGNLEVVRVIGCCFQKTG